jgi:hypothetical protein
MGDVGARARDTAISFPHVLDDWRRHGYHAG